MATTKCQFSFTSSLYISLCLLSVACAFSPGDDYLINCGSRAASTLDNDHRVFTGDDESRFLSSTGTIKLASSDSLPVSSSPLYQTARAFTRPMHYVFPIRDRGTHHMVRLHFYPLQNDYNNLFEAEFHVVVNGFLLLRNFRISKSENLPVIKEFLIPVQCEKVEITFMPSKKSKFGFVNAIEVISAPKDLIADVGKLVGSEKNEMSNGLLKNGFETVHRVNVGGLKVTPFNDSIWRTWVTDDEYLQSNDGSEKVHFGGQIKYRMGGASREVGPDNVYNTARVIKSSNNSIPDLNMLWRFEVDKGYKYMVRMHFCDIASVATYMLYLNVYVNGHLACENLDPSDITNGLLASPFYADFVVDDMSSGVLLLSVGPSNMSLPQAIDGILNGVEIWKMNNSMGSFDGEVCADYVQMSWRGGIADDILPLVAAMFLFLTISIHIQMRRKDSMAWSRLPVEAYGTNLETGNKVIAMKA